MSVRQTFTQKHLRWLYFLLPVISVINTVFPFLGIYFFNRVLGRIKNYYGRLDKISFSSFGKSVKIQALYLDKKNSAKERRRFIAIDTLSVEIDRKALWNGRLALDISIDSPVLSYFKEETHKKKNTSSSNILLGFQVIMQVRIKDGKAEYIDPICRPIVELKMDDLQITGFNLSNLPDPNVELPSEIILKGRLLHGVMHAHIKTDISQQDPTFDLNAEIENMNLVEMNNYFKAYGNFDVNKGTLSLFAEVAAKGGKFKGYLKPEIRDLDVLGPEDYSKNFLDIIWQGVVGAVAEIFQNQKEGELATEISLSGTFKTPRVNVGFAIVEVFYNAFVSALKPSIDFKININSVKKTD